MSVFTFKKRTKKPVEESDDDSSSDDDEGFEAAMVDVQNDEMDDKKGKKKKSAPAPAPASSRVSGNVPRGLQRGGSDSDDEIEAMAPVIEIADDDDDDDSDDDDDGAASADEDTKRRLRILEEARQARDALRLAEREVLVASSEDEAEPAPAPRRRRGEAAVAVDDDEEEAAPAEETFSGAKLAIKVRTKDDKGQPRVYHIHEDEPFSRLFDNYAADRGVDVYECKFMFDGETLGGGSKPRALDMEDDDLIDVQAPPKGKKRPRPGAEPKGKPAKAAKASPAPKAKGSPAPKAKSPKAPKAASPPPREKVLLAFALGDAKPKKFKIYDDDPFSKAFDVFAKLKKGGSFGYSYKARPIPPDATPASLGIRGEGKIDVVAK